MNNSVKKQQYRRFGYFGVGLFLVFVVMMIFRKNLLHAGRTVSGIQFKYGYLLKSVFIETLARCLRKYRGSLVVGTQSVNDFYSCAGAQAAWDNSDWNCFLSQKEESIAQLKNSKRILLDEYKESVITSVKTEQGKYAEVLINGADGYAVGKLLLDPFSSLLFSTKPEDYAAVQELRKYRFHSL